MKRINKLIVSILVFWMGTVSVFSQNLESASSLIDIPKVKVRKSGAYIGLQKGRFTLIEFGAEMQFKRMKLINPYVNAFRMGFNYDFKNNVLGYDAGYWHQHGRLGLTFGGNLSYRTDFDHGRIGLAPVIGFRLTQFHLQTGYTFYNNSSFANVNTFFIALKFVLINKRKHDIDK